MGGSWLDDLTTLAAIIDTRKQWHFSTFVSDVDLVKE